MKKILALTIAALLVMALVGGGTWAYFSDVETSTGNTFGAGTLDLNWAGGNELGTKVLDLNTKAPGDSGSASQTLANVGTLDGELDIVTTAITNTESIGATEYEADGAPGELGANTKIAAYIDVDSLGAWNAGDVGLKSDGSTYSFVAAVTGTPDSGTTTTLVDVLLIQADDFFNGMLLTITGGTASGESRVITDFVAASDTITVTAPFSVALDATSAYSISNLLYDTIDNYGSTTWNAAETMAAAASDDLVVEWRVPVDAGNTIQGDSLTFNITFTLEQAAAD